MCLNLAKLLLLVMTITGIVMPIHVYAHELADTQENHSMKMDAQHDTDGDSISCDHCYHFSSHSLGLMQEKSPITNKLVRSALNFKRQNYASYNQPPPYHPPIA